MFFLEINKFLEDERYCHGCLYLEKIGLGYAFVSDCISCNKESDPSRICKSSEKRESVDDGKNCNPGVSRVNRPDLDEWRCRLLFSELEKGERPHRHSICILSSGSEHVLLTDYIGQGEKDLKN